MNHQNPNHKNHTSLRKKKKKKKDIRSPTVSQNQPLHHTSARYPITHAPLPNPPKISHTKHVIQRVQNFSLRVSALRNVNSKTSSSIPDQRHVSLGSPFPRRAAIRVSAAHARAIAHRISAAFSARAASRTHASAHGASNAGSCFSPAAGARRTRVFSTATDAGGPPVVVVVVVERGAATACAARGAVRGSVVDSLAQAMQCIEARCGDDGARIAITPRGWNR